MKFNLLSGILLALLILSLVFGFTQMVDATASRSIAERNEKLKALADQKAAEAKRLVDIANAGHQRAELARAQAEATLAECRAGKKK